MAEDTRVAYGATCTWWGGIGDVGLVDRGGYKLPCCPHCKGMLFEMDDEQKFVNLARKYEVEHPSPGYVDMLHWAKGRCFPNLDTLRAAYENREKTS